MTRPATTLTTSVNNLEIHLHLRVEDVHHSTIWYSFTSNFHHTSPRVGIISVFYPDRIESYWYGRRFELDVQGQRFLGQSHRAGYQTISLHFPVMSRGANPQ